MKTGKSDKPFARWLDDKIDEWGIRKEVEDEVNRLRLQQKISDLRSRRGLSQTDLAKRVGVSQPMIAKLESGRFQNMTIRTLVRTAGALGARLDIRFLPAGERKATHGRKRGAARAGAIRAGRSA
jgi:DNA-binding XRE family transcriptional regulator